MHELMHFLVDVYFWSFPLGALFFAIFGGMLGAIIAKRQRVWLLSGFVTVLTIFLIPWSFLIERGDSLAPIVYFAIVLTILPSYWIILICTRYIFSSHSQTRTP